jgi:glycosyltransferase involved in cell wall biosynthesis
MAGVNSNGGSHLAALELTEQLRADFDVTLLSGKPCGPFSHPIRCVTRNRAAELIQKLGLRSLLERFASHPEIVLEHLTSFYPCLHYVLSHPPDLIFPHNSYGGLWVAACARALTGAPILYTEHAGLLGNAKCLQRDLYFRPDHLVALSDTVAQKARSIRPQQPVTVIPNGVDLSRFSPTGARLELPLKPPVVLCVASLNRNNHKRIQLALQAVAKLEAVSLLVCGDGPDREYFQALGHQLLGADRCIFQAFPFDRMPDVYRSADVFTLPSINEPFGRVYLEAMASGLPVVAPDDDVRRNIIQNGGILCDVENVEAYAGALDQAIRQNWEHRPRESARRFDWAVITPQYRNLILQMIEGV